MIVKELFRKSNYEEIWQCMYSNYFKSDNYDDEKISYFKTALKDTIKSFQPIEPVIDKDWIVVVNQFYDWMEDNYTECISSDLHKKSDIISNFKPDEIIESNTDVSTWDKDQFIEYFRNRPIIETYGFEFSEWNEVLGFEVWNGSIEQHGLEKCAAAILFEMTYGGFTIEEKHKTEMRIFNVEPVLSFKQIYRRIRRLCLNLYGAIKDILGKGICQNIDISDEEAFKKDLIASFKNMEIKYWDFKKICEEYSAGGDQKCL